NTDIRETSEKNKSLADELQLKNDVLKRNERELNTRLAANYFQHGIGEYESGRAAKGIAHLRRAIHYIPNDDPLRISYRRVLTDRVLQGGKIIGTPLRHEGFVVHAVFNPDGT